MPYASYAENIAERLAEAQTRLQGELVSLRTRLSESDLEERESLAKEITAFKKRFGGFLDELESRSKKLFDEAIAMLSDPRVHIYERMNKRENQTRRAREDRDEAIFKRDRARNANAKLVEERDTAVDLGKHYERIIAELSAENSKLKSELADNRAWNAETESIKQRPRPNK